MSDYSYEILGTLHGEVDKRFIQVKCEPMRIEKKPPNINWQQGKCRYDDQEYFLQILA